MVGEFIKLKSLQINRFKGLIGANIRLNIEIQSFMSGFVTYIIRSLKVVSSRNSPGLG